jgi:hypothetical protein
LKLTTTKNRHWPPDMEIVYQIAGSATAGPRPYRENCNRS